MQEITVPACRLCRSPRTQKVYTTEHNGHSYTIIHCLDCHLFQTAEQYDALSPDYLAVKAEDIDADRLWCMGLHKQEAFKQWLCLINSYCGNQARQPMELLDVGCGTGGFLDFAAEAGFTVSGFDLSSEQAAYAAQRHHQVRCASCINDYLAGRNKSDKQFDLITLWDVLEHIRNPLTFLADLRLHLRPGGILFISVPNGGAIGWKKIMLKMIGKKADFAPWEHVFYYTPNALRKYLTQSGFTVRECSTVKAYFRAPSKFEWLRRAGFRMLSHLPSIAPQIFATATVVHHE